MKNGLRPFIKRLPSRTTRITPCKSTLIEEPPKLSICFVIIPFDGDSGPFTKRYNDVYKPAIITSGFQPYRVDRDPSVQGILEKIVSEISSSTVCFADITEDNPNVWFEVGYGLAQDKPLLMVSDKNKRRKKYPFDIQNRHVVEFTTESPGDFDKLRKQIETRLPAIVENRQELAAITTETEGLSQHEITALICIMQNQQGMDFSVPYFAVQSDMESAGHMKIAVNLALVLLEKKGFIHKSEAREYEGFEYSVSETGFQWLITNENLLVMKKPKKSLPSDSVDFSVSDDVPF